MKKIFALLIAVSLVLSLAACGGSPAPSPSPSPSPSPTATPEPPIDETEPSDIIEPDDVTLTQADGFSILNRTGLDFEMVGYVPSGTPDDQLAGALTLLQGGIPNGLDVAMPYPTATDVVAYDFSVLTKEKIEIELKEIDLLNTSRIEYIADGTNFIVNIYDLDDQPVTLNEDQVEMTSVG